MLLGADGKHNNVLKVKPPLCLSRPQIDLVVDVIDEALSAMPKATPAALRKIITCADTFKEDAAALARVRTLIRRHGVGAGPTWQGHTGEEAEEDGTITLTFSGLGNVAVGVALGALVALTLLRR